MKLGIIGGSGLCSIDHFTLKKEEFVETPFGTAPSPFLQGTLDGAEIVFLARHGREHSIAPHELNHRANIYAMKKLGVTHILSISAVGSLREDYAPRDVVIVDQYFDRTTRTSTHTFFGDGVVAHISFAHPVCPNLSDLAYRAAERAAVRVASMKRPKVHRGGTYVNIEGPAFSTKAESQIYKAWGLDVIGMTNLAEAKLAREAGICYSTVAMVTDYDSWHTDFEAVTVEMVVENLRANAVLAKEIVRNVATEFDSLDRNCECAHALDFAIITEKSAIPRKRREELALIIGNRLD